MNELEAVKACAGRSSLKSTDRLIETGEMVAIIKARHIIADNRFQAAEQGQPEEEKKYIIDAMEHLRAGESHSSILAATPSTTAVFTAIMLDRLEARGAFLEGGMSAAEAIQELRQKTGAPCHPVMSRFRCMTALIEKGIIQPNYSDRKIKPTMSIPATRDIIDLVTEKTGITGSRIKSAERSSEVVRARFLVIFILRHVSILTLSQIGVCIGGRDHTTVLNSLNQTRQSVFSDAGEAFSTHELCNVIDLTGQKRYCEFIANQASLPRQDEFRSDGTPRKIRLTITEQPCRQDYRRTAI